LPLALTPRVSGTSPHNINIIPPERSSLTSSPIPSLLQHNVVLHSSVNEPLIPATNRFDLNLPVDRENRNQLNRKANSLMTVFEHTSTNETALGESSPSKSEKGRARSPSSIFDLTYQRTTNVPQTETDTDDKETVKNKKIILLLIYFDFFRYVSECIILPKALCSFVHTLRP
jgi:hypothetical protein